MLKNSRYQHIVKTLTEDITTLAEIEFLIAVAPRTFNIYLQIFKWEGPLMKCLHEEMTMLLYQLVEWSIKEEINACKTTKDLLTLNVSDARTLMKFQNINYGTKTKGLPKNYCREKGRNYDNTKGILCK